MLNSFARFYKKTMTMGLFRRTTSMFNLISIVEQFQNNNTISLSSRNKEWLTFTQTHTVFVIEREFHNRWGEIMYITSQLTSLHYVTMTTHRIYNTTNKARATYLYWLKAVGIRKLRWAPKPVLNVYIKFALTLWGRVNLYRFWKRV